MHVINALFVMLGILLMIGAIDCDTSKVAPSWVIFIIGLAITLGAIFIK